MVAGEQIVATSAHPGGVVLTAMQWVAYQGGLGEIARGFLSYSRDERGGRCQDSCRMRCVHTI